MTALDSQTIETTQIQDATDLQRISPSFSIQTGGPSVSGLVFVSLRGQQNQNPGTANDPTVATYIDGVYIPRLSQGQTDLADIERIEVLRGPQGTLFGRNTTGGAINITTALPTDYFEAVGKAEIGDYDYRSLAGTVNVPLTEGLAIRVNGQYRERDGYVKNRATGGYADDPESYFVRGKIRYEGSNWDVMLTGDYNRITDHGQKVGLVTFNPAVIGALPGGAAVVPILNSYIQTKDTWYETNGTGYTLPTINAAGTAVYNSLPGGCARPLPAAAAQQGDRLRLRRDHQCRLRQRQPEVDHRLPLQQFHRPHRHRRHARGAAHHPLGLRVRAVLAGAPAERRDRGPLRLYRRWLLRA